MPTDEVLLWENPWYGEPRRHSAAARRGRRRNPARALALPKGLQDLTQGVGMEDVLGAGAGLLGAGIVPRWIVAPDKATSGAELTTGEKWMRVLVGAAATLGIGFVARQVVGNRAAKAAIVGGLAGTTITAINSLTTMRLGAPSLNPGGTSRILAPVSRQAATGRTGTQTPGFEDIKLY